VVDVLLLLGRKQHSYAQGRMLCLHYTLCLMQLSFVRNLILLGCSDWYPRGWIISHRCSWMRSMYFVVMPRVNLIVVFLTYHVYIYSINCPTVICLPSILFYLWRDTTSELWTLVLFPSYCNHLFTFLHCLLYSHTIHNLCFKQTGEIDSLIASWEQSTWLCVCRFHVAASMQSLDEAPYINCQLLSQTSKHHLQSSLSLLFKINIKPWFLNWGKTSCYTHHTFLLGFPMGWSFSTHQANFLAPLPGK
jgi:hypothetical protein